jgi:prevent-host-death family protein
MRTISVDQARTELPQVLLEVEAGGEVIIARGEKPIARLVPIADSPKPRRPKVGELRGAPFPIPDEAFAPLTTEELKEWGL